MDFTFEEIDYLISLGLTDKSNVNKSGINSTIGRNASLGYTYIHKDGEGRITKSWSNPEGFVGRVVYKTFDDYKND